MAMVLLSLISIMTQQVIPTKKAIEKWNNARPHYPVDFDRNRAYQAANKNEQTWGERDKIPKGLEWYEAQRAKDVVSQQ
jgi:hypothetical protein